jgi:hypothetical protein
MKRFLRLIVWAAACSGGISAQQIELLLPDLPGKSVYLSYFSGSRTDSILLVSDGQGTGKARLPDGYKGLIRVHIPGAGAIECIGGEPLLRIEASDKNPGNEQVRFPGSRENTFFHRLLEAKSRNTDRYSWVQFGMELYDPQSELYKLLEKENEEIGKQAAAIAAELSETRLYASSLIGFMDYINELSLALDSRDTLLFPRLRTYFHTEMDWQALYTSGRAWEIIHACYAALFDQATGDKKEKEHRYVTDIYPLFARLQEPLRSAFLETTYQTCERMGWDRAKDRLLAYIFDNKVEIDAQNGNLRRILSAEKTRPGNPAPAVRGLQGESFRGITLLVFYESGCDNCVRQLEELKKHYERLRNSGIRVVSLSADTDERVFTYHSRSFPWQDKLCDYKGFMGENFVDYAILATPTLFVIADGLIIGHYATLGDTKLF